MVPESSSWTAQSTAELAQLFSDLGQELASERGLEGTLRLITARSVKLLPAAQHAAISRGRHGRFETVASTGELPLLVDQIQYDLNSGPCVDAAVQQKVYRSGQLATDQRWPEFGRRAAAEHGVHSMLSVRLFLEGDDLVAALNHYSAQPDAFDSSDETVALMLATHASTAMASARLHEQVHHLERALQSNRGIGVAIGVLMNQYKLTQSQAFDLLRMASQHGHRKLVDVALDVTETGTLELPPLPARANARSSG
ncbi:MAG TPA: GAF and ANTAR domain-containing protein [Jatrophihabitans sp.]|jgi:GAF domain-containing protein|uniref:GAF and ANTAR domain-containing protein n=1 Tax=Jatrophihabitans sp. TaxID=1932789 RepID=UPI002F1ADB22